MSFLIRNENESAHLNVFGIETRLTMCENMVAISGLTRCRCSSEGWAGQVRVHEKRVLQRPLLDQITALTQVSSEDSSRFNIEMEQDPTDTDILLKPTISIFYWEHLDV